MEEIKQNTEIFDLAPHYKRLYQEILPRLDVVLFDENVKEELCSICLQMFAKLDRVKILPCRHVFHNKCIDAWLANNLLCPMCKQDIRKFFK